LCEITHLDDDNDIFFAALCHRLLLHRTTSFPYRLSFIFHEKNQLESQLKFFLANDEGNSTISGVVTHFSGDQQYEGNICFVYSGQGPQWWKMGRQLYNSEPVFRLWIDKINSELEKITNEWSLVQELIETTDEKSSRINDTNIAQPCIFALQVALTALWLSWGVRPKVIVGHSVGEVTAAYVGGRITLAEGVQVIYHRARLQHRNTRQGGRMLALTGLSKEELCTKFLQGLEDRVSIAAVNSPTSLTLSGDNRVLQELYEVFSELKPDLSKMWLKIENAFHSSHMEKFTIREELLESLKNIEGQKAEAYFDEGCSRAKLYSTVTGNCERQPFNADYWWKNVRNTVQFSQAMEAVLRDVNCATSTFLEISPHPVLVNSIEECVDNLKSSVSPTILFSLKRKENEQETLLSSLCQLPALDWSTFWQSRTYSHLPMLKGLAISKLLDQLPLYSFNNQTCWFETKQSVVRRRAAKQAQQHPLLGFRQWGHAEKFAIWKNFINLGLEQFNYFKDHVIQGQILFPATGFIELAIAAMNESQSSSDLDESSGILLQNVVLSRPLILSEEEPTEIHTILLNSSDVQFFIYSRSGGESRDSVRSSGIASNDIIPDYSNLQLLQDYFSKEWTLHALGTITQSKNHTTLYSIENIQKAFHSFDEEDNNGKNNSLYVYLTNRGYRYGPAFRCTQNFHYSKNKNECFSKLYLPDSLPTSATYFHHPAVNDASFHTLIGFTPGYDTYVPTGVEKLFLSHSARKIPLHERQLLVYTLRIGPANDPRSLFDVVLVDARNKQVLSVWTKLELKQYRLGDDGEHNDVSLFDRLNQTSVLPPLMQTMTRTLLGRELESKYCFNARWLLSETALPSVRRPSKTSQRLPSSLDLKELISKNLSLSEMESQSCQAIDHFILHSLRRTFENLKAASITVHHYRTLMHSLQTQFDAWTTTQPISLTQHELNLAHLQLLQSFPSLTSIISLIASCCENLTSIVTGGVEPLQILFSEENKPKLKHFYSILSERQTKAIFSALTEQMTKREKDVLTILEVGAGTGTATRFALEILLDFANVTETQIEYVFTDVSASFFVNAQQELSSLLEEKNSKHFLRLIYRVLDIEDDSNNKFKAESFDIIFASLAVHVATDLVKSIRYLRQLLIPNGLLFLIESTIPKLSHDIVFGLLPQWWQKQEECIRKSSLRTTATEDEWMSTFKSAGGFQPAVHCITDSKNGISCLTAQKEETSEQQWIIFSDNLVGPQIAQELNDLHIAENITLVFWQGSISSSTSFNTIHIRDPETDIAEYFQKMSGAVRATIIYAWPLQPIEVEEKEYHFCLAFMSLLQAVENNLQSFPSIFVLTKNAYSLVKPDLYQSCLIGFARTAIREYANHGIKLFDLEFSSNMTPTSKLIVMLVEDMVKLTNCSCRTDDNGEEEEIRLKENPVNGFAERFIKRYESCGTDLMTSNNSVLYSNSVSNYGTIVISGGLGGLGLALSKWMIQERNIQRIVLLSRRSSEDMNSKEFRSWINLQKLGTQVQLAQVDVTDYSQVLALFQRINNSNDYPVRGVFHLAMVLHDCLIQNMTPDILHKSMKPKVHGAWNLHRASLETRSPIEFFIMFSSIRNHLSDLSSANYNAGNNFLDSLANFRRQLNLPALSVSVPGILDAGFVEQKKDMLVNHISEAGHYLIPAQYLFELIEKFHVNQRQVPCPILLPVDWNKMNGLQKEQLSTSLRQLVSTKHQANHHQSLITEEEKSQVLRNSNSRTTIDDISLNVSKIFGSSDIGKIDAHRSLIRQGLDSLMAVSLAHWINKNYSVEGSPTSRVVTASDFLQGLSISELARRIDYQHYNNETMTVSSSSTSGTTATETMPSDTSTETDGITYRGTSFIVPCDLISPTSKVLFCVPGVIGLHTETFSEYTDQLRQYQLVFFRSSGYGSHDDDEVFLTSVEKIAEEYICQMKRYQPFKPYSLLGVTRFGSLIVTEMLHQLESQCHEDILFEKVFLLDPNVFSSTTLPSSFAPSKNCRTLLESIEHLTIIYNSLLGQSPPYDPVTVGREKAIVLTGIQKQMIRTISSAAVRVGR
jgi:acyl transferase domain-containing protein/SAM-dependent methyltransferase